MINTLKALYQDAEGATAVEYGLIVALIFLAAVGGISYFSDNAIGMWESVSNTMSNATS